MSRLILILLGLLFSSCSLASTHYQVDLILFSHPLKENISSLNTPLIPLSKNVITLKSGSSNTQKPYHLLSPSKSGLRNEYYLLNRKHQYQILGHYSWIQPGNNQNKIAIPSVHRNGWEMLGTLKIRQSNYFTVNAELQVSPPNHPQSAFTVTQNQRLKANTVYYFDHPQIGMLIKIHKPS